MKNDYRGSRLASVGLVSVSTISVLNSTPGLENNTYSLSAFGKTFLQHLGALKKMKGGLKHATEKEKTRI